MMDEEETLTWRYDRTNGLQKVQDVGDKKWTYLGNCVSKHVCGAVIDFTGMSTQRLLEKLGQHRCST